MRMVVTAIEEITRGQQLVFSERKDIRLSVEGDCFSACKAKAKAQLAERGLHVVSTGLKEGGKEIHAIVRASRLPAVLPTGSIYRAAAANTTASGRRR